MKSLYKIILFLIAGLFIVACERSTEKFELTPSERIEKEIEKYNFALLARETWVLEYFPDEDLKYGGWVFVINFRPDNTVEMWFEGSTFIKENPKTVSEYIVEFGTGPMLKFRTHNDYLHWFTHAGANGSGYNAYEGDFEFKIMSVSEAFDRIELRGNRTGNTYIMYPLPGEYTPESFVQTVRDEQSALPQVLMSLSVNGDKIGTISRANNPSFGSFTRYYSSKVWTISYTYQEQVLDLEGKPVLDENNQPLLETIQVEDKVASIFLPGRIMKFYEPYVFKGDVIPYLKGQTMQTFSWNLGVMSPLDCFVCQDSFMEIKLEKI